MKLTLSNRLLGVQESATLKMNALAKDLAAKGMKVYNLTAGEPDFPVPKEIQVSAIKAIENNFSKYTPVPGTLELRKAIAEKLKLKNQLNYSPDQVVVTVGAKQAIFNFLMAVLNDGDEVLIPSPYWVSYPEMVKIMGGVPKILETSSKTSYKITPEQLRGALTPKTKILIINSPSNPSGVMYSRDEFVALAKVLEGTDVFVCSDEIYENIVYEGKFTSFASVSTDAFSRTITINGFSKAYAMTGWRLGYAAGLREIIAAMALLQGQSTSGATSIVQASAIEALKIEDSAFLPMISAFKKRLSLLEANFSQCKDFSFIHPQGAFYFLLNVERLFGKRYNIDEGGSSIEVRTKVLQNSEDVAFFFLDKAQVVTVAGKSFGCDGFLRLSFAVNEIELQEAVQKIISATKLLQ